MTTDIELDTLVTYDGGKIMTAQELIQKTCGHVLFGWHDQYLVTTTIAPRTMSESYHTPDGNTSIVVGKTTMVGNTPWARVKGRGVRRAALEAGDGSVVTIRAIEVEGPDFTLHYVERFDMECEPGANMEAQAYETGEVEEMLVFGGDVASTFSFFDLVLNTRLNVRVATAGEIAAQEAEAASVLAVREAERAYKAAGGKGWSPERKAAWKAKEAARALEDAHDAGETFQ